MKRLINTLLELKQFNLETIAMHIEPDKNREEYNKVKKQAIEQNFRQMHNEISEARTKLMLAMDTDQEAERLTYLTQNANNMCSFDEIRYNNVKTDLDNKVCSTL